MLNLASRTNVVVATDFMADKQVEQMVLQAGVDVPRGHVVDDGVLESLLMVNAPWWVWMT